MNDMEESDRVIVPENQRNKGGTEEVPTAEVGEGRARWLAIVITSVWLAMYLGAMFFSLVGVFAKSSDVFLAAAGILAGYADSMAGAVMLILAFYFAAPHMAAVIDAIFARMGFKTPK